MTFSESQEKVSLYFEKKEESWYCFAMIPCPDGYSCGLVNQQLTSRDYKTGEDVKRAVTNLFRGNEYNDHLEFMFY